MKHILKKSYLLGLSLLLAFSVIGFVNVTNGSNGVVINTKPEKIHESSLYWLYLSGVDSHEDSWLNVIASTPEKSFLSVLNGLIIGGIYNNPGNSQYVAIGGGDHNSVGANNAGIGGGRGNSVNNNYGAIGGGYDNTVGGDGGVVIGGSGNKAKEFGAVVGGLNNENNGTYGVVLGGNGNKAGNNSLALGQNSNGGANSFAWNQVAGDNKAGINANNGVLIGTYVAKPLVALVVDGAVKLGKEEDPVTQGEINNKEGCIKIYDGTSNHVLGKTSEGETRCGAGKGCQFGKTILQHGDVITTASSVLKAYKAPYSTNCANERINVTCVNGELQSTESSRIYSYCYKIDDKPI